jgi:23S rRNA (uracil1939-C5)-methyltransferase
VEGFAVFVIGALAGEEVKAHVIKMQPTYAIAKATEILKPSPDRVNPACPVFAQCGGCTLWHLSYPAQLRQKQQWVQDALSRLGGFSSVPMQPIIGMEDPTRNRNKGSFPFAWSQTPPCSAFMRKQPRLVPFSDCPIQDERIVDAAQSRRLGKYIRRSRLRRSHREGQLRTSSPGRRRRANSWSPS